uniref:Protein kinase domain-containing protein n=1 Tax=Oryza brachyantha TaxID=4533 RepID=J3LAG8_ORYBR
MAEEPPRRRGLPRALPFFFFVVVPLLLAVAARAQQEYEANLQNACYASNGSSTLGYTCHPTARAGAAAAAASCDAYLVFRSAPPLYASAVSISYLLNVVVDVSSSAEYGALASGKQTTTTNTTSSSSLSAARSLMASDVREALESLTVYKYSDLEKATAGFSEERRVPGTGVYRGVFNGDAAAVKRVAGDVSGEVGILKRVNHSSLIRLSGLCVHRGDTYLVFEFAENGALSDWLHGGGARTGVLGWKQRVQVAFDVADGLNYLHHYTSPPCVHKNLKSSNVLLDADLRGKLSSFGLARALPSGDGGAQLTRHVVGTQGYLSPEYLEHGLITPKLDVFAFGVILLELLSGKEAAFAGDGYGEALLWEAAEGLVDGCEDSPSKVRAFMDPRLGGDYPLDLAMAVASLAAQCVAAQPRARPAMDVVFVSLAAVYNSTVDWDPSDHGNSGSSLIGR